MTSASQNRDTRQALEERIRTILPEQYQDSYDSVQPVSMGSAPLTFGADGKVAWNAMWGSFCDLAMAGGPPHKGTLLEPAPHSAIDAEPERYQEVVDEIARGIGMVSYLPATAAPTPGWVAVECLTDSMASWLLRAIVMENVSARSVGQDLYLPGGPAYRLEKEIKNVVTAIAKTSHYWLEHMYLAQQRQIADLFIELEKHTPLVEPAHRDDLTEPERQREAGRQLAAALLETTGLRRSPHDYIGWLGLECRSVAAAVWMMRALVASNVLARREGTALFVPVNADRDPGAAIVATAVSRIYGFAQEEGVIAAGM